VGFCVKDKLLSDRFWTSAKAALPQAVADDGDRYRAGLVFLRQKCATCDERDAENRKQSRRDVATEKVLRFAGVC